MGTEDQLNPEGPAGAQVQAGGEGCRGARLVQNQAIAPTVKVGMVPEGVVAP